MDHVMSGKRRAIMKTNPFFQTKHPPLSLKFPRFGEHPVILLARVIDLDERLDHMLPDAILWTGTVSVRMKRIETDAAEDGQPFLRGSHRQPKPRCTHQCAQTCNCAVLEKPSAIDSSVL